MAASAPQRHQMLPWLGTAVVVLITLWVALLVGAVIGVVAFANNDARGYAAFSAYVVALIAAPVAVARWSLRHGYSAPRALTRGATAVLLLHIPLLPVVVAAMAM